MEVDGFLDQPYGYFFWLALSAYCLGLSMTADGNKKEVSEKMNFRLQLDVRNINPNEMNIRVVGHDLVINGKHEERGNDHGFISRSFSRRYVLLDDVDEEKMACQLSKDGKL